MKYFFFDFMLWLISLAVGFYTMTYARWLLKKKNKRAAIGVGILALFTVLYPGIVLFFIHR